MNPFRTIQYRTGGYSPPKEMPSDWAKTPLDARTFYNGWLYHWLHESSGWISQWEIYIKFWGSSLIKPQQEEVLLYYLWFLTESGTIKYRVEDGQRFYQLP